ALRDRDRGGGADRRDDRRGAARADARRRGARHRGDRGARRARRRGARRADGAARGVGRRRLQRVPLGVLVAVGARRAMARRRRRVLAASKPALDEWARDHKLDFYTFSDTVSATTLLALANDRADGKQTLIRKALETVRARYEGRDLAGIVLISDGAATGSFD